MTNSSEDELYRKFRKNDVLVAMLKAGLSSSIVADLLAMTRSAVIGRKTRWAKDTRYKKLTLTEIFGEEEAHSLLLNPRKFKKSKDRNLSKTGSDRSNRPMKTSYTSPFEKPVPILVTDLSALFVGVVVAEEESPTTNKIVPYKAPKSPKPPKVAKDSATQKVVKSNVPLKKERVKPKVIAPIEKHDYTENPYSTEDVSKVNSIEVNGVMVWLFGDEHLHIRKNAAGDYDSDIEVITEQGALGKRVFNYSKSIAPIKASPLSMIAPDCSPVLFNEVLHRHCRVIIGCNEVGEYYCCGNKIATETKKFCSYHRSYMIKIVGR